MLKNGYSVRVTAKCEERYQGSGMFRMAIKKIEFLEDVKQHGIERFIVTVDSACVDDTLTNELLTTLKESAGATPLYIRLHHTETNSQMLLRAGKQGVHITKQLLNQIEALEHVSYDVS